MISISHERVNVQQVLSLFTCLSFVSKRQWRLKMKAWHLVFLGLSEIRAFSLQTHTHLFPGCFSFSYSLPSFPSMVNFRKMIQEICFLWLKIRPGYIWCTPSTDLPLLTTMFGVCRHTNFSPSLVICSLPSFCSHHSILPFHPW